MYHDFSVQLYVNYLTILFASKDLTYDSAAAELVAPALAPRTIESEAHHRHLNCDSHLVLAVTSKDYVSTT